MSVMVGTPRMIRLLNKDVIEGIIKKSGPITKPEIAKLTNLSLVTVNKTVKNLLLEKRVKMSGTHESTGGRRARYFEINEELYYVIGLCYGKNGYSGVISNTVGEIIYRADYPARTDSYGEIMSDTCAAINALSVRCAGHQVTAIGMGVPGVVKDGTVTNIPNIPDWEGLDISGILEEKYQVPVLLENDINLAAMGAYHRDYKDKADNLVLLYLERGIGSGLILNKELFKGSTNFAGELSYIPVRDGADDGKKTKYRGNFENQIMLLGEEIERSSGGRRDDLMDLFRKTIADGLMSIICVVNPEIVVLNCTRLNKADIGMIEAILGNCIDKENVPEIVELKEIKEYSIQGVINKCIRETMPVYSLSSRKRG